MTRKNGGEQEKLDRCRSKGTSAFKVQAERVRGSRKDRLCCLCQDQLRDIVQRASQSHSRTSPATRHQRPLLSTRLMRLLDFWAPCQRAFYAMHLTGPVVSHAVTVAHTVPEPRVKVSKVPGPVGCSNTGSDFEGPTPVLDVSVQMRNWLAAAHPSRGAVSISQLCSSPIRQHPPGETLCGPFTPENKHIRFR